MSEVTPEPVRQLWSTEPDEFGVPLNFLGSQSEDFYGAIGRIALLGALLEYRLLVLYQALVGARQDEHTQLSATQLIERARTEIHLLRDDGQRSTVGRFLDDAEAVARRRNDYVHSLWPVQSGTRLFGWRPPRSKDSGESVLVVETTMADVLHDIEWFVTVIKSWDRVFPYVSGRAHLRAQGADV